jgi:hypothetical protein
VAGGNAFEVVSYRTVNIRTTYKKLRLAEVWYAPDLDCWLLFTSILNDGGVIVVLENRMLKVTQNGVVIFEGSGRDGLCYLDQPTEARALITEQVVHDTPTGQS